MKIDGCWEESHFSSDMQDLSNETLTSVSVHGQLPIHTQVAINKLGVDTNKLQKPYRT